MLFPTIAALAVLLAVMHRASRDLLFPPAVLCTTWILSLAAIAASGDLLLPVSEDALLVYLVGTTAFCLGGFFALWLSGGHEFPQPLAERPHRLTRWALDAILVTLVVGLPAYWATLSASVGEVDFATFFYTMRVAEIERGDTATSFDAVLNLNIVAQFAALAMLYESDGSWSRRWRTALAALLALVYGGMTGTKVYAVQLLMGLFFVSALRARKVKLASLAAAGGSALVFFSFGLIAVNFVSTEFATFTDALIAIAESIQLYWLGGIVAFSKVTENPNALTSTQPVHRFFLETARSLGFAVDVPSKHAEYVNFTPTDETNVFTIYFSYFKDYGWAGTVLFMAIVGVLISLVYVRAQRRRDPLAIVLLARLSVGLVLSVHAEHFFTALNGLIKLAIFLWVLYDLLPALEARPKDEPTHA